MDNPAVKDSSSRPSVFDSSRFRKVKVFIFTAAGVFSGYTYCQQQQRLLDALNKGTFNSKLQNCVDFIPLFDLEVHLSETPSQTMDTAYVRKSSVLFIGEADSPAGSPTGAYPVRRKKPLQTTIHLPGIVLTGNMHSEMWEELQDAINRCDQFIPVTNVDFNPPLPGGVAHSNFVAVNKDHIIYVGK